MIRSRFQQNIVSGRFTLPAVIVFSALVWIMAWGSKPDGIPSALYPFWQRLLGWLPANFIGEIINFLVYGLAAYLLIELNNAYSLIRIRTSFQCSVFVLLVTACPFLFPLQTGGLAALCFLLAVYFLFRTYQKPEPVGHMFQAFLFIGIGTILFPGMLLYIPLFFIGAFNFKSLGFRTFFAGILGLTLPYWFLFGHAYFYNRMELFYEPFLQLAFLFPADYSRIDLSQIMPGLLAVLLFIVATVHFWATGYKDKIRTRSYLNFWVLVTVWTILYCCLQPQYLGSLYPVMLVGSSILGGHLFVVTSNRLSNLFFIVYFVILLGLTGYNLWMISYN